MSAQDDVLLLVGIDLDPADREIVILSDQRKGLGVRILKAETIDRHVHVDAERNPVYR